MALEAAEQQAKYLARENKRTNPDLKEIYWFPHEQEVRLVESTEEIPASDDGMVHPFYFKPVPDHHLPLPSGIALVRPDEVGRLQLPARWGEWRQAQRIEVVE